MLKCCKVWEDRAVVRFTVIRNNVEKLNVMISEDIFDDETARVALNVVRGVARHTPEEHEMTKIQITFDDTTHDVHLECQFNLNEALPDTNAFIDDLYTTIIKYVKTKVAQHARLTTSKLDEPVPVVQRETHPFYNRETDAMRVLRAMSRFGSEVSPGNLEVFIALLNETEPAWNARGGNKHTSVKRIFDELVSHRVAERPYRGAVKLTAEGIRQVEVSLGMSAASEAKDERTEVSATPSGGSGRQLVLRELERVGDLDMKTQRDEFLAVLERDNKGWVRDNSIKSVALQNYLQALLKIGHVERVRRGVYRITDMGRATLLVQNAANGLETSTETSDEALTPVVDE
jgi:hypothetical protein